MSDAPRASVRLLRDALVERGHDGGLLLFREALGRRLGEHARVAAEKLRLEAKHGHEDAPEDGIGAVEHLCGIEPMSLRRRAILTAPTRHDGQYIRSLEFLVSCPPEIAWHVLGYWRCQYPIATQFVDQLGFR